MPPQPGCARGKVWLNPGQVHGRARGRIVAVPLRSDAAAGKGAARVAPRRYCPLFTRSHPVHRFCVIFYIERGWGRERKSPRNATPQC